QQRSYLVVGPDARPSMKDFSVAESYRAGTYRLTVDTAGGRYELRTGEGLLIEEGAVGDSIGSKIGFIWAPTRADLKTTKLLFTLLTPRDAARALGEQLETAVSGDQSFLRIGLKGQDRVLVTDVVNAVADRFVEIAAQLKRSQVNELVNILETQRQYAENNLKAAEIALERFRVETITLPSDKASPVAPGLQQTRDPVMQNYFEMKIQREQLRRDIEAVQRALSSPADAASGVDILPAVASASQAPELTTALSELTAKRAELRALRQQYTDEHPVVQRLVKEIQTYEQEIIPRLGGELLGQLNTRAEALDSWINSASADLQQIPPRMIEEARLRRQVEIAERLHNNLRERYEEARLATATTIPDVRVLDRASVPERPVSSTGMKLLLIGLMAGFALGLGVAILLDRFDKRVRYPDQVTSLGLPVLGALPHVKSSRNGSSDSMMQAIEALREIRLNVGHAIEDRPLVLAVTSPGAGDGKTFLSCNLALACADAGQRTLLIDGDTRRGELHRLLLASRQPGLTDYLRGDVTWDQVIQNTQYEGLHFIGGGTRRQASPNLLGSAAMEDLMRRCSGMYDVILIDCPPLAAGVDPYLIGTLVGNVLLVLRTGRTDRALAETKLQAVDRLPIRVIGAVLNGVENSGVYRYYSYLPGYEVPPDEEAGAGRQLQGV
ncbi:MAG TPA: polysaccharide biosynthesis tyrosine autokinase, partial [Steroidobacteraceae bacterium]